MTAAVLSGLLTPISASASSAQAGYAAANALIPGVNRGWRSSGAGSQWIQIDLGASLFVAAIALQAINGANSTLLSVYADNSATPTTKIVRGAGFVASRICRPDSIMKQVTNTTTAPITGCGMIESSIVTFGENP